jgi:hypothetical protein
MRIETKKSKQAKGFFTDLAEGTQQMVREALEQNFTPETWNNGQIEELECHARSGFTPFDHNRGGLEIKGFNDIGQCNGSGMFPAHKEARKEIERQITQGYEYAAEAMRDNFVSKEDFEKFFGSDLSKLTYHNLEDLAETLKQQGQMESYEKVSRWVQDIQECENDCLGGNNNTIMYSIRFMYHGSIDGIHSASISAAVNTEGPYHRSHISWAPGVFCEGAKEIEVSWKNQKELAKILDKKLAKLAKEVL